MIGTAKVNGLDPECYSREVVAAIILSRVGELLPWKLVALIATVYV